MIYAYLVIIGDMPLKVSLKLPCLVKGGEMSCKAYEVGWDTNDNNSAYTNLQLRSKNVKKKPTIQNAGLLIS